MTLNHRYLKLVCALTLSMALSAVVSGCAQPQAEHVEAVQVASEAVEYVTRFEQEASSHGRTVAITDLVIEFGEVGAQPSQFDGAPTVSGARGVCEVVPGHSPVVRLSRDAWDRSSDSEREELVFHELGHCVLGLTHVAGLNDDGIPRSVMNPVTINGSIYKQNRAFYLTGLFK